MKKDTIKIALIALMVLGALFDVYTTLADAAFIQLEANPLMEIWDSIWILVLMKAVVIGIMAYWLWFRLPSYKWQLVRYAFIYIFVTMIALQIYAGINNYQVKQNIVEKTGHTEIEQVSHAEVSQFRMDRVEANKRYLKMNILLIFMPMLLSLTSFWVWERLYYDDE